MKGAKKYYDLFNGKSQQIGRLFFQLGAHARGKCFEIFLLPEGMELKGERVGGNDVVEVYGMISGQRGWTETYGWLHTGKWQDDFDKIVEKKTIERKTLNERYKKDKEKIEEGIKQKTNSLLSTYS